MSKWYSELQAVGVSAWTVIPEDHDHKAQDFEQRSEFEVKPVFL